MDKITFCGIELGETCPKCRGGKGGYKTYLDSKGNRQYETRPALGAGVDYIYEKCKVCEGKGIVDTPEGAQLRRWLKA